MAKIRIRGPGGVTAVTLGDDATVADLLNIIREKTGLNKFGVKYSYPPKPLTLHPETALISSLGVSLNNEQLIISSEEDTVSSSLISSSPPTDAMKRSQQIGETDTERRIQIQRKENDMDVPELPMPTRGSTMLLRVMPDDNSCLFRAFGAAVIPGDDKTMTDLRKLVASAIQRDPITYSEVVLDKPPHEYCEWIQHTGSWGGAIELLILSKHFDIEVCSIDVQSLRIDRFNSECKTKTRCILVYSGIHYDTIVQSPSEPPHTRADAPPDFDLRVFKSDDEEILRYAHMLCNLLKQRHYYTDTGAMEMRCMVYGCGWTGHGVSEGREHAMAYGHWNMEEYHSAYE